eukprot:TRINITY_DN7380_c0_g1_i1.p1 TRINITY_DN7380_c0_g1~~TRINITY_DN7380_c0_g1_i1.p1  ORF type:complete len:1015 (-),score=291.06 TRINITY_DN7380_c0_g1_i1:18-3062(-)
MEGQLAVAFQYSLSPSDQERKAAENQIAQLEFSPGFAVALLKICTANDLSEAVRQGASIRLKRVITQRWEATGIDETRPIPPISEEEKTMIKGNLLEAIIHTPMKIKLQLGVVLGYVAERDFPEQWTDLLPKIQGFLASKDLKSTHGALLALHLTLKKYELMDPSKKQRAYLDHVVSQTFPLLLELFRQLSGDASLESGQLQLMLCKIFWVSINFGLPDFLMNDVNFRPWMEILLKLLQGSVPSQGEPTSLEERTKWPWWKCKKWAAQIFTRLLQRFGDKTLVFPTEKNFAQLFADNYVATLLTANINLLASKKNGGFLPDRVTAEAFNYVDTILLSKKWYPLIAPHADAFFREIVFPEMCFSERDYNLWQEDPMEYLRKDMDPSEDFYHPKTAATNITLSLGKKRAKHHLLPIMNFVVSIIQQYGANPQDSHLIRQKEGVMLVIGALHTQISKNPPFAAQVEPMVMTHIVPEFQNPVPFVRSRAVWAFSQFWSFEWKNPENFLLGLRGTIQAMMDRDLPVRVTAALSLRFLIQSPLSTDEVRKVLPQLLDEFFKVMNSFDSDELVNALELLVDKYETEMGPYAVTLCAKLVASFERMADNEEDDEESGFAALECLGAVQTILQSIHAQPQYYPAAEQVLLPLLNKLTNDDGVEFFEEAMKILSFLTFYGTEISPGLWALFPKMVTAFNTWAFDFLNDLVIPFENYIAKGTAVFVGGPCLGMVLEMYKKLMVQEEVPDTHSIDGCHIIESVLLNCRGLVDQHIEAIIELALHRLKNATRAPILSALVSVIANCMYYNPILTMAVLDKRQWTQSMFGTWFQTVPKLKRIHDKKLTIMALSGLISLPQLPPIVHQGLKSILEAVVNLQIELDKQRAAVEEERQALESEVKEGFNPYDDYQEEDDEELDDDDQETFTELQQQAAAAYTDAKDEDEDNDFDDDFDEDFDEDENFTSPLDHFDELVSFLDAIHGNTVAVQVVPQLDPSVQASFSHLVSLYPQRKLDLEKLRIELAKPKQ